MRRLERLANLVKTETLGNEIVERDVSRTQELHPGPHAVENGIHIAEVAVGDAKRHTVPPRERDLPRAALVVADDRQRSLQPRHLASRIQAALGARHFEGHIGARAIRDRFHHLRKRF